MSEPSPPNFSIRIDHHHHVPERSGVVLDAIAELRSDLMSELGDFVTQAKAEWESYKARRDTDLAELRRLIQAGISTDDEKQQANALLADMADEDIEPNFPAPPVEPNPDEPAPEPPTP